MSFKVRYSPAALNDIRNIYHYITVVLKAPVAAKDVVNRIRERIKELDTFPEKHPIRELKNRKDIRQLTVGNYEVFYTVYKKNNTVMIARILYGGMNIDDMNI